MTVILHHPKKSIGVSSIELFFDLVFVFVITQITQFVEHAHSPMDFLRAAGASADLVDVAGYVWLTSNAGASSQMRLVLIAAMAGFLTVAPAHRIRARAAGAVKN